MIYTIHSYRGADGLDEFVLEQPNVSHSRAEMVLLDATDSMEALAEAARLLDCDPNEFRFERHDQ